MSSPRGLLAYQASALKRHDSPLDVSEDGLAEIANPRVVNTRKAGYLRGGLKTGAGFGGALFARRSILTSLKPTPLKPTPLVFDMHVLGHVDFQLARHLPVARIQPAQSRGRVNRVPVLESVPPVEQGPGKSRGRVNRAAHMRVAGKCDAPRARHVVQYRDVHAHGVGRIGASTSDAPSHIRRGLGHDSCQGASIDELGLA
jgi:hypothetical protein